MKIPEKGFQDRAVLSQLLKTAPFHKMMNYTLENVNVEMGLVSIRLPYGGHLNRSAEGNQIHGGAIGALIDVAATFAVVAFLDKPVPTINLRVDYLRPVSQSDLVAEAVVRRAGQSIGVADVDVFDDQRNLVALGRGDFFSG